MSDKAVIPEGKTMIHKDAIELFRDEFRNEINLPKRRQLMALCDQALEATALREENERLTSGLKWLEDNSTLHHRVEILYVVDGYEVSVWHEDGVTQILSPRHGETLLEAIDAAKGDEND